MRSKPRGYKEGLLTGIGLISAGVLLQIAVGKVEWDFFAAPVNYFSLAAFIPLLLIAHILRDRVCLFRWLSSIPSAVTSIAFCSFMTVVMGLIRQRPSDAPACGFPWMDQMLSNWSFVLVWTWMTVSLGLTILRVAFPIKWKKIPFILNHLGLFVAVVCAVLGSADLQRLKMTARTGVREWRAVDEKGFLVELPVAIELKSFDIDEYPPNLMLVDDVTGKSLPWDEWKVTVLEMLEDSAPIGVGDTATYREYHAVGSCASAFVVATDNASRSVEGWVSCGSHVFPAKELSLDGNVSVAMPGREPQRYVSVVDIYTPKGDRITDTIMVNRPCRVDGWKIYRYSYDRAKGKWSDCSVFEIIRDPWLPAVYAGILMLIAGAVCMFVQFGTKKREEIR